jgi:hypothetical protein
MALYRTCPSVVVCSAEFGRSRCSPTLGTATRNARGVGSEEPSTCAAVGRLLGAYDVQAAVLFGADRLANFTHQDVGFLQVHPPTRCEHLRIHLVNDNLSLHWTPRIRTWAAAHNLELVPTPTSASYLNRIEAIFRPLREFVLTLRTTPVTPTLQPPCVAVSAAATPTIKLAESANSNPGQELPDTAL